MLNVEQYLCINIPLKFKTALANFRCSKKKIQIELGENIDIHNLDYVHIVNLMTI